MCRYKPQVYSIKVGAREYKSHGHVILMKHKDEVPFFSLVKSYVDVETHKSLIAVTYLYNVLTGQFSDKKKLWYFCFVFEPETYLLCVLVRIAANKAVLRLINNHNPF